MFGIDMGRQREMMDESLGIILRLMTETEPITYKSDWFELNDATLQLRPYQHPHVPVAVASVESPSGVTLAGKHGVAVLSMSVPRGTVRKTTLKDLWSIAEESAAEHGKTVHREDWGIVSGVHLAESRKEAFEDIRQGGARLVTEYFADTLGNPAPDVPPDQIVDYMVENNQWIVGTPDDCIAGIERLQEMSGGFGHFMIRVEDWASREKLLHSYELLARYVMPHFQGSLIGIQNSRSWVSSIKEDLQAHRTASIQRATDAYDATRQADKVNQAD
jgi:limonene 1,2-monooxygenase